jgi:CRISPR-associated protein Cmr4
MTTDTPISAPKKALYTQQRFLFMTVDPVHVGTGGYRLGRVDMSIAREPGTNLPKIPGTSLAGATRSYAAMRYGKPEVAGQQKKFSGSRASCPIIYTFGTATDANSNGQTAPGGVSQAGTVSISDAQILFFPVSSMVGPVWISTVEQIREAWGTESVSLPGDTKPTDDMVVTNLPGGKELNLSWLLFQAKSDLVIEPSATVGSSSEWAAIGGRIVLTTPKIFSQVVNNNLEVRTSVSIDPMTGAAESGALFTYEAIPRTTWLWCDVVEDDYRPSSDNKRVFPVTKKYGSKSEGSEKEDNAGDTLGEEWTQPLDVVRSGIKLIEYLGVGGMGTRGFGRMRHIADWDVNGGGKK